MGECRRKRDGGRDPWSKYCSSPLARPPQYFFGARSNQGESTESLWVRFWVIISLLLLALVMHSGSKSLRTCLTLRCNPISSWHYALNIAPLKNRILYGQCTLMAPTSQGQPKKSKLVPSVYMIATLMPFSAMLKYALGVGGSSL